jgi:hypothetical protein
LDFDNLTFEFYLSCRYDYVDPPTTHKKSKKKRKAAVERSDRQENIVISIVHKKLRGFGGSKEIFRADDIF